MVILSDPDHNSASTSSTPLERKRSSDLYSHRFDVFLSFRGIDTRYSFVDHLSDNLYRAGILTFQDDNELKRGESLGPQLENAIKQCFIAIIVFSKNYASSKWCLEELVRILEEKKIRGDRYKVIPIFYKVEASDIRFQKGSYKEALNEHKKKGYVRSEKIEEWEATLTEAGNLVGHTLNEGRSETEFMGRIVREVENSLPHSKTLLNFPEHLMRMEDRAKKVDSWLKDERQDKNVLVICGIGGVGKTTIAKHLYDKYSRDFEASCFLKTITLMWNRIGVHGLQSQLLSGIHKRDEKIFYNCCDITEEITRTLWNMKVLIVLDDVSETEQLEELLGEQQRFCPGSKIIVTTRNMSLRTDFIVQPEVHIVECLNDKDSLKLFCWHAFRQVLPLEGYMQLSKEILVRCEGLPLSLKVLGTSLRKKMDVAFWEKQLQKLNEIANPDIQKVMQISYNSLEDNTVKDLFLDVACFFVGEKENYVVYVLDHCDMHATVGIQKLIDRCLITKSYDNKLTMHQVIQDMGKEIIRQECLDEPGRRSRLWCHKDSFFVLKNHMGTEAVQGLVLGGKNIYKVGSDRSSFATTDANPHLITDVPDYMKRIKDVLPLEEGELKVDAFTKMVNLKFIKFNNVHFNGSCDKFPEKLRWIIWHGFPLEYVPKDLPLKNLVALDLQHSKLRKVWKGCKEVKTLKILDMSYSLELRETPNFRGLPQLEKLILKGCSNLVKVCNTIEKLNQLMLLDLTDCRSLMDLPALPKYITTLELSGCAVGKFPKERKQFGLYNNSIMKFVFPSIESRPIRFLASLPEFLVRLGLKNCNLTDECFPRDFSPLSSLEYLDLSENLISRLPDCIRNLQNSRIRVLSICDCPNLESVIHPPSTVTRLELYNDRKLLKIKCRQNTSAILKLDMDELKLEPRRADYIDWEGVFIQVVARNVERKVIKNLGLESVPIGSVGKVWYEDGIFSTFVKSTNIPPCFKTYSTTCTYEERLITGWGGHVFSSGLLYWFKETSKVSYTIPSSSVGNSKIQGLNICFSIRVDLMKYKYIHLEALHIKVIVSSKTKDLQWTNELLARFENTVKLGKWKGFEEPEYKKLLWVSTWKCDDDLLEAGDEFQVSFLVCDEKRSEEDYRISVEECGIRTVYEEDDLDNEKNDGESLLKWTDKLDSSFSINHIPHEEDTFSRRRVLFTGYDSGVLIYKSDD